MLVVLAGTAALSWPLLTGGQLVGLDMVTFYLPMYAYLGDRLATFDLPGWNPYQFAGHPFAANPLSGWLYAPVMLLFTVFPLGVAASLYLVTHAALAGLGTYAFARIIGLNVAGAAVAGVAVQLSGWFYRMSVCCPAYVQTVTWLPLCLLAVELALRANAWPSRLWWGVATGVVFGQIVTGFTGQGSYYALLVIGTWLLYRTLIDPLESTVHIRARIGRLTAIAGVIALTASSVTAAAWLPLSEFLPVSTLANGFDESATEVGGWVAADLTERWLGTSNYSTGDVTLILAVMAPIVAGRRFATPALAFMALAAGILTLRTTTPLHTTLYWLLPEFDEVHTHWPERIAMLTFLPLAMLAGITVSSLPTHRGHGRRFALAALLPLGLAWALALDPSTLLVVSRVAVVVAVLAVLTAAIAGSPRTATGAAAVVLAAIAVNALVVNPRIVDDQRNGRELNIRIDVGDFYAVEGAAAFLHQQRQAGEAPARFFGYDAALRDSRRGQPILYAYHFAEAGTTALVVNNRATVVGIEDIQGTDNPVQVQRYIDLIDVLNGEAQDYHEVAIFPTGLGSPLLDLLNVAYVIVPAQVPPGRPDLLHLSQRWPTVYRDGSVRVIHNPDSLPRAWIVHDTVTASSSDALKMLATGKVDPRQTAVLTHAPPPLGDASTLDRAEITDFAPERIEARTSAESSGLLVLSELAYPAWRAYVDGEPTDILTANGALRSVPIPAGEHTVELRFESTPLTLGITISAIAYVGVALLGLLAWHSRRPKRKRGTPPRPRMGEGVGGESFPPPK